jgi:hypothetical protein
MPIECAFPIVGSHETPNRHRGHVRVELRSADEVLAMHSPTASSVISQPKDRNGRWYTRVTADPRSGYLLEAVGLGVFHISAKGTRVWCGPTTDQTWRWQRALVGQVLPFVSALRGFETLHASAACLEGGAIAVSGPSGSGKTSVLAELLLSGASFVTDDVLALQTDEGAVIAHPGIDHLSLRHITANRIGRSRVRRLGTRIGRDETSLRLGVDRDDTPVALSALCFLDRSGSIPVPEIHHITAPGPALLLGATFNLALRSRERLTVQLDVCASIARTCRVIRVGVPQDPDFTQIAAMLVDDLARPRSEPNARQVAR